MCISLILLSGNISFVIADEKKIPHAEEVEIGYKNGLYIKKLDGSYSLKIHFLIQSQYHHLIIDNIDDNYTFILRHGQMRFFGNFHNPKLKYRIMFELPGTQGGATSNLRDMWVDWQWKKYFQIKSGQFIVYYNHENLQPTWALPFVDRSIISSILGFERDLGVDIHGIIFSDHLGYDLYLMNGDGRNQLNLNNSLMTGGRVLLKIFGKSDYLISNPESFDDHRFSIGIAAIYKMEKADLENDKLTRVTGDVFYRFHKISILFLADRAHNSVKNKTDTGFLTQVGSFILHERLEIVSRWAKVFKEGALGSDIVDSQTIGASLNYFFHGNSIKLQTDYSHIWNSESVQNRDDDRVRLQLQLFF